MADSETATTLLDELEHRVDAMIEIAGSHRAVLAAAALPEPASSAALVEHVDAPPAASAAEPAAGHAAERDQVPTVSDVVSRLGADDETLPPAANIPPPADDGAISAPTVAMLTAMVQALRDSISAAALEAPAPQRAEATEVVAQPVEDVAARSGVSRFTIYNHLHGANPSGRGSRSKGGS